MFTIEQNRSQAIRALIRAGKLPFICLIFSFLLFITAYLNETFNILQLKNITLILFESSRIFSILAGIMFIYNLIAYGFLFFEKQLQKQHKIISLILNSMRKGLRIIIVLIAINIMIETLGLKEFYLAIANDITRTIIIAAIGWIAIQILYTIEVVLYEQMTRVGSTEHKRLKALYTKTHIIRNIANVIIAVITFAAILMSFNSVKNLGISLLASAGFLTAIIGLSAQKTLVSLFSGIQIALSQVIKIGDIVMIEKESGVVEEVTFTYITLKLGDRRRLVVPINYFIEKPFENWSHEGYSLRSSLHINVDYMMPIEPLRKELDRILTNSPLWDGIAKKLIVTNLNSQSVEVRIQVSAANADNLADLKAEVREKILVFMQDNFPKFFPHIHNEFHQTT